MSTPAAPPRAELIQLISDQGVLPLFNAGTQERNLQIALACLRGGARVLEFTNRSADALADYVALRAAVLAQFPDALVGVGTIWFEEDAEAFADAGAPYLVSPGVVQAVGELALQRGLLYIPGACTPTEIDQALKLGGDTRSSPEPSMIKLFPGDCLGAPNAGSDIYGARFVARVGPVFKSRNVRFMVTGGVSPERAKLEPWVKAGTDCVGMGSELIPGGVVDAGDWGKIETAVRDAIATMASLRGRTP